jgi:iron complex outermembrane recepter protein
VRSGLSALLSGTGLSFQEVGKGTVSIRKSASDASLTGGSETSNRSTGGDSSSTELYLAEGDTPEPSTTPTSEGVLREEGQQLEEIVVTAQKRQERLLDVPQSVSVLSADTLAKLGAVQFRDFASTVPGLTFSTSGAGHTNIALRGVVATSSNPTVGVYVDEVPYGSSSSFARASALGLDVGLFDVDRVEVLRGPQGTLYGASAMGGLIKYVSKLPDSARFGGEVQTGVSNTHEGGVNYNGSAALNLPIAADKAGMRLSGFYSHDAGYVDNITLGEEDVNRSSVYGGRVDVLLTPTDALTLRVGGFLQNISREGTPVAEYSLGGLPVDGSLDQRRPFHEPFDQKFRLASATVGYDFGGSKLTSITSYQTMWVEFFFDSTRTFLPLFQARSLPYNAVVVPTAVDTKKFAQEVRLASQGSGPFEWLLGGFYTRETNTNTQFFLVQTVSGQQIPDRTLFGFSGPSTYKESAAFADLTYHLTQKFDVSGGIRYAQNDQVSTQIGTGLVVTTPRRSVSDNVATYLANARYRFNDRATGYLRYATGYRPGGPNFVVNDPVSGLPVGAPTFESDGLKSYEAGFKAETVGRTFGIDLAVYRIDWSDMQVRVVRNGVSVIDTAGEVEVNGAELALSARPIRGFTATGAFAYQDASILETVPTLGAVANDRLPNVPRFSAALSADYELPLAGLRPIVGATFRHVSERMQSFTNATAPPQYRLPDYTTVDVRTGLTFSSINVQLYAHNLLDKRAQMSPPTGYIATTAAGPAQISILQPRTIGLSVTARF